MASDDIKYKTIVDIVPINHLYQDTDKKNTLRNRNYRDFVKFMYVFAKTKGHPFPEAVAVQAGYESRYGASDLARNANNTFGVKVYKDKNGKSLKSSACSTGEIETSHVLNAIGLDDEKARSSFRIGLGRYTNKEDLTEAIHIMHNTLNNC